MGAPRWDEQRKRWRVEFRWKLGPQRHRAERFFESEAEARAWAAAQQTEIDDDQAAARTRMRLEQAGFSLPATPRSTSPSPMPTWQSFGDVFLTWLPLSQAAPTTIRTYESALRCTILRTIGHLRLDELTPARVDALRAYFSERNRSVKPLMTTLSAMAAHAVREGLIPANPCHRPRGLYRSDAAPTPSPPPRSLTREQRQQIWERWPSARTRAGRCQRGAYRLAAFAGLRHGEIRGLRVQDLELDTGLLRVEQQAQAVPGAGHLIRPPKFHSARRVPLGPQTCEILEELADEARQLDLQLLLASPERGRCPNWRDPRKAFQHRFQDLQSKLEVDPPLAWRDLRHTFLTLAIEAGYPAALVEQWVGHAVSGFGKVSTTHYLGQWDVTTLDRTRLD